MSGEHSIARAALKPAASTGLDLFAGATLPSPFGGSKQITARWQQRRISAWIDAMSQLAAMRWYGFVLIDATAKISRRFNGRSLGDGKCLRASRRTVERYWYRWRLTRDPRVLQLNYRHVTPYQSALQRKLLEIWMHEAAAQ